MFSIQNQNNYDGASGGIIQFTKNYDTLGDMTGNERDLEINQRRSAKGTILPKKDTFLLYIT